MFAKTKVGALRPYSFAIAVSLALVAVAVGVSGARALLPLLALAAIELTFSFDNAVLNSQVLSGMNKLWRTIFLTVGLAIAVFGTRALLPLVLVAVSAGDSLSHVINLALHHPTDYAHELEQVYPVIAAFGGVFLLMVGLRFFGERKEIMWLNRVEGPLGEFNQPWWLSAAGASLTLVVIAGILAPGDTNVLIAGALGALSFFVIKWVSKLLLGAHSRSAAKSNSYGLTQLIYLELLDASFSFDSVVAAFAITKDVVLIAAGLGIGAVFVRSITLQLLNGKTLTHYRYVIHGAHYAILSLSFLLLAGIRYEIPEVVTGLLGMLIVAVAFENSIRHNRRQAKAT